MYCIQKFVDCWAIFNLDSNESRALSVDEVDTLRREVPALNDPGTVAWYGDDVPCINKKP